MGYNGILFLWYLEEWECEKEHWAGYGLVILTRPQTLLPQLSNKVSLLLDGWVLKSNWANTCVNTREENEKRDNMLKDLFHI